VITVAILPTVQVCAKGKKRSHPAPPPAPALPAAPPLPSELLQSYSANNLEHLLGPLNEGALPRAELMRMETDFKARLALAAPEEKSMLQAALAVCVAFDKIMDEREKTVSGSRRGSSAATSAALGANRTVRLNDWRDELQAGREAHDEKMRRGAAKASDAFVVSNAANNANAAWFQRVQPWRKEVQQLLVAERQAELAARAPAIPAALAAAPPVAPVAAGALEADPVVGSWLLEGRSPLELNADHTISGDRHGRWVAPRSDDGKRHYELYWNPPKDWIDYLVLSDDGRTLNGTTRGGEAISAYRP
jgi:hypothetical protein